MCWRKLTGCLALCGSLCSAALLPQDVLPAREEFEVGLHIADKQGQERITAVGEAYLQRLREIARQQQAKGRFRGLVAVRDELARFTKTRAFSDHPVDEPVELRDVQTAFQLKWQQLQYSNEFAVVKFAEHYVQALAVARDAVEKSNAVEVVRGLDEECDRVVGLARLRQALEATKVRPPVSPSKPPSNTVAAPTDARIRRPLDICRPSTESLSSMISYEARVVIYEDVSQLKTRKTTGMGNLYRSLDGQVGYAPRIVLTCHHAEILSGTRLVIEYFSRSLPDHVLHHEVVEKILLPRLERSKSFTIEAKGLQLNRSEQVSVVQSAGVSTSSFGAEFYGLILHLVDPDGHVIWQRFSPQALERELTPTPPEK